MVHVPSVFSFCSAEKQQEMLDLIGCSPGTVHVTFE